MAVHKIRVLGLLLQIGLDSLSGVGEMPLMLVILGCT